MSGGRVLLLALGATTAWALALTTLTACEDEPVVTSAQLGGTAAPQATASPPRAPAAGASASAAPDAGAPEMPPLPLREFQEADFSESDRSRDPFRSFESLFATQARGRVTIQRQVLVDRFALDELKLVGVVSRAPARALLTDPTGLGWVAKVGDFVGKAEIVHAGGPTGVDVAVNWRVDRIRDSDVVFIREDPSHPEIPPTTRVIALRPLGEQNEPAP
ncbi:pilus assembly protein PilP [Sorangium sp. So ce388]|uniref:pilus assembly protein PilP n=1 Tax=Sorangium sp. So ce388 TaxID=3133309 RepID=UPI003F5BA5CB